MTPVQLQRHLIAWSVLHPELADPRDFGTRADGIRDDDGIMGNRTLFAMAGYRSATGAMALMQPELYEHLRATVAEPVSGSLALRALAVGLREWCDGVREEPPGMNKGPRIADYFAVCERNGRPVQTREGAWCAASASWCTKQALRPGEALPHGLRIGGAELEGDLKRAQHSGRWLPASEVRDGGRQPRPGDLVILSRAGSWTRHVCRLVSLSEGRLWTLGGNESGTWRLTPRHLSDPKLLGFGVYPSESRLV